MKKLPTLPVIVFLITFFYNSSVSAQSADLLIGKTNRLKDYTLKELRDGADVNQEFNIQILDIVGQSGGVYKYKDLYFNVSARFYYNTIDVTLPALLEEVTILPELIVSGKQNRTSSVSQDIHHLSLTISPYVDFSEAQYNYSSRANSDKDFEFVNLAELKINVSDFAHLDDEIVEALKVELFIEMARYSYELPNSNGIIPSPVIEIYDNTSSGSELKTNQIAVTWTNKRNPVSYELEWLYVESSKPDGSIDFDFSKQAIRVSTTNNFYTLNNIYESGYLIFRVRTVKPQINVDSNAITERKIYGQWSLPLRSNESITAPFIYSLGTDLMLEKLNWQYSRNFSSQGKNKEVVRFYDGSNKERQAITILNSNKEETVLEGNSQTKVAHKTSIVAQETYYDFSGKPVIQMLPAPIFENTINSFQLGLNKVDQGGKVLKDSYDNANLTLPSFPLFDDQVAGASMYYSSNSHVLGSDGEIPDAEKYPYSFIQYLSDGSGRVKANFAPGKEFITNKKNNTRYVYAKPFPSDLEKLFGTDIGEYNFYKKNIAVDPNGQISISYQDIKDRTVATSIAGKPRSEADMDTMISTPVYFTDDLMNSNSDFFVGADNSWVMSFPFFVAQGSTYKFKYSFDSNPFLANCVSNLQICYDCRYDFSLIITDEDSKLITKIEKKGVSFSDICNTNGHFDLSSIGSFNIKTGSGIVANTNADVLEVGLNSQTSYTIQKILKLNTDEVTIDAIDAFETLNCSTPYTTFEQDELNRNKYGECNTDFSDNDMCGEMLREMIADFSPGGYFIKTGVHNPTNNVKVLGIYNRILQNLAFDSPYLLHRVYYRLASTYGARMFTDEYKNFHQFSQAFKNEFGFTSSPLVSDFEPRFADFFVQFHPNYCSYLTCKELNTYKSKKFMAILDQSETVEDFNSAIQLMGGISGHEIVLTVTDITSTKIINNGVFDNSNDVSIMMPFDPIISEVFEGQTLYNHGNYSVVLRDQSLDCFSNSQFPLPAVGSANGLQEWLLDQKKLYFSRMYDCSSSDTLMPYGIKQFALTFHASGRKEIWQQFKARYKMQRARYIDEILATNACEKLFLSDSEQKTVTTTIEPANGSGPLVFTETYYVPYYNTIFNPYVNKENYLSLPFYKYKRLRKNAKVPNIGSRINSVKDSVKNFSGTAKSIAYLFYNQGLIAPGDTTIIVSFLSDTNNFKLFACDPTNLVGKAGLSITDIFKVNFSPVLTPFRKFYTTTNGSSYFDCGLSLQTDFNCYDFNQAIIDFNNANVGTIPSLSSAGDVDIENVSQAIFANFLNYKLGLNVGFLSYYNFSLSCNYNNGGNVFGATIPTNPSFSSKINDIQSSIRELIHIDGVFVNQMDESTMTASINGYMSSGTSINLATDLIGIGFDGAENKQLNVYYSEDRAALNLLSDSLNNVFQTILEKLCSIPSFESSSKSQVKRIQLASSSIPGWSRIFIDRAYRYSNGTIWVRLVNRDGSFYNDYYFDYEPYNYAYELCQVTGVKSIEPVFYSDKLDHFIANVYIIGSNSTMKMRVRTSKSIGTVYNLGMAAIADPTNNSLIPAPPTCEDLKYQRAIINAKYKFKLYRDEFIEEFKNKYALFCLNRSNGAVKGFYNQALEVTYPNSEHQFTLYYYDQADNLIKTVPPEGVEDLDLNSIEKQGIKNFRSGVNTTPIRPMHSLNTTYIYNADNQIIEQETPNGGTSYFWYDRVGRLVLSQNQEQRKTNEFSYTLYDQLSRIKETGAIVMSIFSGLTWTDIHDRVIIDILPPIPPIHPNDHINTLGDYVSANRNSSHHIIKTIYDQKQSNSNLPNTFNAENLRSRVAAQTFYYNGTDADCSYGTYYSYDPVGNVKSILHDYGQNGKITDEDDRFKRLDYYYDNISENVIRVYYQLGKEDQFVHEYEYDAENRIINVKTTEDGIIWDNDAKYEYFLHGPLSRTELGQHRVQGIDYAYTLQGWLKMINSAHIGADLGNDIASGGISAKDEYGFALNYFDGDYKPISSAINNNLFASVDRPIPSQLYNGNISSIELFNGDLNIGKHYKYDQLNRIIQSKEFDLDFNAVNGGPSQNYIYQNSLINNATEYSYDRNGNITSLKRLDGETNQMMDDLIYNYKAGSDQLDFVTDLVLDNGLFPNDIDNQSISNYEYDAIGNLTQDVAEGISNITWTPSGKVASIIRENYPSKDRPNLSFEYDAMGNRVKKTVEFVEGGRNFFKSTYYVRDAQGNLMATYDERDCNSHGDEDNYYRFSKTFGSYTKQVTPIVGINVLLDYISSINFHNSNDLLENASNCLLNSPTIRSTIFQQMVLSDYFAIQPVAYQRVLNYSPYFYANDAFVNSHTAFYNVVNDKHEVWLEYLRQNPSFIQSFYNSVENSFNNLNAHDKNNFVADIFNQHRVLLSEILDSDPNLFIDLLQVDPSDLQMLSDAKNDKNLAQDVLNNLLDELLNNHFDPQVDDVDLESKLKKLNALLYVTNLDANELWQVFDPYVVLLQLMEDSYQSNWIANPSVSYNLLTVILRHIETNSFGIVNLNNIPDYNPMYAVKWNEDVNGQFLTYFIVTDIAIESVSSASSTYFSGFNSNVSTLYFTQEPDVRSYILNAVNRNWNTAVFKNTVLAQVNNTKINLEQTETTAQLLNYFKIKFPLKLMQQNYLKDTLNCALMGMENYSPFDYVADLNSRFGLNIIPPCPTSEVYLSPVSYDLYGSSRLGTIEAKIRRKDNANTYSRKLRAKTYELTDHLGNIMVTITDKKLHPLEYQDSSSNYASYYNEGYKADVTGRYDRYPFGMEIASRSGDFRLEDYTKDRYKTIFYGMLNDCADYSYNSYQAEAFETCETDLNPFNQPIVNGYTIDCSQQFYINLSMSLQEIIPNLDANALYEFRIMITQNAGRVITAVMDTAQMTVTAPGASTVAAVNASATKYVKFYYLGSHLTTLAGSNNRVDLRVNVAAGTGFSTSTATISDISINEVTFGANAPIALRNGAAYRYGFNGMERDDEVSGSGNSYTTEFRQYDTRLGRWKSIDPKTHAEYSPYSAFDNNPVYYVDPQGADSEGETKDDLSGGETTNETTSTGNEQNNTNSGGGKEIKTEQLQDALKGKTVEDRVKNINEVFEEGDYIDNKTIFDLANISPKASEGESEDITAARGLIKDIDKIVKTSDGFQLQLKNGKSSTSQSFPAVGNVDITIKNKSTIKLDVSTANEIKIVTDGLKLGWFGFPNATLSGDKIKVLGFNINLARKKK